jgi:protein involved in polysaccharide export with SLBB domain
MNLNSRLVFSKTFFSFIFILFITCKLFAQVPPGVDPAAVQYSNEQMERLKEAAKSSKGGPTVTSPTSPNVANPSNSTKFQGTLESDKPNLKGSNSTKTEAKEEGEDKEKISEIRKREKELTKVEDRDALPPAKIFGQEFFRNKSIESFSSTRKLEATDDYILDTGDEISVTIWGDANYSGNFKVEVDGFVDLSTELLSVPRIYVRGLSFGKVRKAITSNLSQFVFLEGHQTQIAINLNFSRTISVNIAGEVFKPGTYSMPASNSALNALVASGGPSQIGSVRNIKIFSANGNIDVDVYRFIFTKPNDRTDLKIFLRTGDYIFVPIAKRVIKIAGAVKRPHEYELLESENLSNLLEYAGGLMPDAYKNNVQIKRVINSTEKIIDLNLDSLIRTKSDFRLFDGDSIGIAPIQHSYTNFVEVVGAVALPGKYQFESNNPSYENTIGGVLAKAGVLASAKKDRAYVIRTETDFTKSYMRINLNELKSTKNNFALKAYDVIRIEAESRFKTDYGIVVTGAVRYPDTLIYSDSLRLLDAIYLCGGLKDEAEKARIQISRIVPGVLNGTKTELINVNLDSEPEEVWGKIKLEKYDQIFIRSAKDFELQRNVMLTGEIQYPGIYSLIDKNEKISTVIQRAGGTTSAAFLKGAVIIRKKDDLGKIVLDASDLLQNSKSRFNYILQDGDSIFIPRIKDLVTIRGFVNHPEIDSNKIAQISVPFYNGENAKFYVEEYGAGVNRVKFGKNRLIYVTYPSGKVSKTKAFLFFRKYPQVESGSIVTVHQKIPKPKRARNPINIGTAVQGLVASTTSLLTLYLIVQAAFNK